MAREESQCDTAVLGYFYPWQLSPSTYCQGQGYVQGQSWRWCQPAQTCIDSLSVKSMLEKKAADLEVVYYHIDHTPELSDNTLAKFLDLPLSQSIEDKSGKFT